MASKYACRACRRTLQQQVPSFSQLSYASPLRQFSIASTRHVARISNRPPEGPLAIPGNDAPLPAQKDQLDANSTSRLSNTEMRDIVARQLRQRAGATTETYVAYGATERLFRECSSQADYKVEKNEDGETPKTEKGEDLGVGQGWWYEELGLTPTFNTWAQISFLHMWMLTVRIRQFPAEHAPSWQQHLIDHFSYDAENRMAVHHNMAARGIRNKYLKDLFIQWRGVIAAYDEGLIRGDAVLAAAVWRNVWKAEEINARGIAQVVSYIRREIQRLEGLSDEDIAAGEVGFGGVEKERNIVEKESPRLNETFGAEEQ